MRTSRFLETTPIDHQDPTLITKGGDAELSSRQEVNSGVIATNGRVREASFPYLQLLIEKGIFSVLPSVELAETEFQYTLGTIQSSTKLTQAIEDGSIIGFLYEFTALYRNIFATDPWGEYLCCTNSKCKVKQGLGEVLRESGQKYSTATTFEEQTGFNPTDCFCKCGSTMQFFYPPLATFEAISDGFKKNFIGTLAFSKDERLIGFFMSWISTVRDCWDDKVIKGKKDLEGEGLSRDAFDRAIFALQEIENITPDGIALNSPEWGVDPRTRFGGLGSKLLYESYHLVAEKVGIEAEKIFCLGCTQKGSVAYTKLVSVGWKIFATESELPDGKVRVYVRLDHLLSKINRKNK